MHCVGFLGSTFVYVELSHRDLAGIEDREILCFSDGDCGEVLMHQARLSDLGDIESEDAYYKRMRKVL